MLKTIVACTEEIDDMQAAVQEILTQLGITGGGSGGLLKNAIGIVCCHYEFVESGVFEGLCCALPFAIVGTVSSGQAAAGRSGGLLLTLMVLTSDTVEFVKTVTEPLTENPQEAITKSYKEAQGGRGNPAMTLVFAPFLRHNVGDYYVEALSGASGGSPCFGTIAIDDTQDISKSFALSDGGHLENRIAMVLIFGEVNPKFYIANISQSKALEKNAVITKSRGNVIIEINNKPVLEFFEEVGLAKASHEQYALSALPFLLDYKDGSPKVSKFFIQLTPENHAICAGAVPEGSILQIAATDSSDVMLTTGAALSAITEDIKAGGASGLLIYSCIGRSLVFPAAPLREAEFVTEKIGSARPFMMGFSGGEICPTQVLKDKAVNRFHNNAFVACAF